MSEKLELVFDVYSSGEPAAGLRAFNDTVTVTIESGDPGGEPGEFLEAMRVFLQEWYDVSCVRTAEELKRDIEKQEQWVQPE